MDVKPGYKQTEVGVIPGDWDAVPLASITPQNRKNGIVDGPFGSNLKTIHYRKSGVPIITSGYVTDGIFFADKYLYVDPSKFQEEKRSAVQPGDIVMAKIGERCGASAVIPPTHETGILSGNALKITVDESRHSTSYVWQVLWSLHVSGKLMELRTVGAQPALSMPNLKLYRIPLPPTKSEQEAIAKVLSDMDALIEALEKLIEKKRRIKEGAMQELLTGKRRLPGFQVKPGYKQTEVGVIPEDWEVRALSLACEISAGCDLVKDDFSSHWTSVFKYPIYSNAHSLRGLYGFSSSFQYAGGQLTVTARGDVGHAEYRDLPFCTIGRLLVIDPSDLYCAQFIADYINQFVDFALESTGVPQLTVPQIGAYSFAVPPLREQRAIAEVLSDMDAEIESLEAKLTKNRNLKGGMMQELLTGKTRLI